MSVDKRVAEEAKRFFSKKWKQYRKTNSLTGACVFATAFSKEIFGGEPSGGWHHVFLSVGDEIIDLTQAVGVKKQAMERIKIAKLFGNAWLSPFFQGSDPDPYLIQPGFLKSRDFKETWKSVLPRAKSWANEFKRLLIL